MERQQEFVQVLLSKRSKLPTEDEAILEEFQENVREIVSKTCVEYMSTSAFYSLCSVGKMLMGGSFRDNEGEESQIESEEGEDQFSGLWLTKLASLRLNKQRYIASQSGSNLLVGLKSQCLLISQNQVFKIIFLSF